MKKTFLAILMILVLATAGLFATYTVAVPGAVTATLNATIGDYLAHGFNILGVKYQPTTTINDAFGTTAPSFKYGYKTNAQGDFTFKMSVGDFINQTTTGTVKIASVTSNMGTITYETTGYTIFNTVATAPTATERNGEAVITIYPAKATATADHTGLTANAITNAEQVGAGTTAPAGSYVSIITFSIIAI